MMLTWKQDFVSRSFPSGQDAKDAEDGLKAQLKKIGESLGGEFFLCTRDDLQSAFIAASLSTAAFEIKT